MMFKTGNYALLRISEIRTSEDLFYYSLLFLFLPTVCGIVFSVPMYFLLRVKNIIIFFGVFFTMCVGEYCAYTWLASQENLANGLLNATLTIAFFGAFFYKYIFGLKVKRTI